MQTPCKLSTYALEKNGYARVKINGKKFLHHRIAYAQANGVPIAELDGLVVRHRCDNRACINPEHLELGTQEDNVNDMYERQRHVKKHTKGRDTGYALSADTVRAIRAYAQTHRYLETATKFGVSEGCVAWILNGRSYTWVK